MKNKRGSKLKLQFSPLLRITKDKETLLKIWGVLQFLFYKHHKSKEHPFKFILKELKEEADLSPDDLINILKTLHYNERIIEIDGIKFDNHNLYKDIPEEILPRPKTSWEPFGAPVSFFFSKDYIFNDLDEISCGIYESPFERYSQCVASLLGFEPLYSKIPILSQKDKELILSYISQGKSIEWRCRECRNFLDNLDSLEKIENYLRMFNEGKYKKCKTKRHPNMFTIENGNITFKSPPIPLREAFIERINPNKKRL